MSYYYNYYIGYEKDGKLFPLGPYNCFGELSPAIWRSRNFASDLHEKFRPVAEEQFSNELKNEFEYESWDGKKRIDVKYLPMENLPSGSFIKEGYFLIDDVKAYRNSKENFDGFHESLDPVIYNAMAENEMKFGRPEMEKDCEGHEYRPHSASDYMYFSYPDYGSEEYEAFVLNEAIDMLIGYSTYQQIVILETEG